MRKIDQTATEWVAPEPAAVARALAAAGVSGEVLDILPRDDRFAARLAGDRMAWFATGPRGLKRLRRERRVLRLLAAHCGFQVPFVTHEAPEGWDVRDLVVGPFDPGAVYERVKANPAFARQLGAQMGAVLAAQHKVPIRSLVNRLPRRPAWPESLAYVRRRLPQVTDDAPLTARAQALIEAYFAAEAATRDRVLVHADFGFHNLVIDPGSGRLHGVFDYDGAALADPAHDFKYMLLDDEDESLLEAAIAAYEPAAGVGLDLARIRLLNAASAVTFLAFRAGAGPDERPAGRTLAEDLRWTRMAMARAGF